MTDPGSVGPPPPEQGGAAEQAVAGPGGVAVTARAVGQMAVSWTADAAAIKYYVFRSAAGGALAFLASVLDSSGGPPSTSYVDMIGIVGGTSYCYAIQSQYPDGTMSDVGEPGCGTALGAPPGCRIAVSRVAGLAVRIAITASCSDSDGWSLDYRLVSSAGGLASATVRDHPCGSVTRAEILITGQLPLIDLVTTGWISNAAGRVDCTVTME